MFRLVIEGNFFVIIEQATSLEYARTSLGNVEYFIDSSVTPPVIRFRGLLKKIQVTNGGNLEFRLDTLRNASGNALTLTELKNLLNPELGFKKGGGSGDGAVSDTYIPVKSSTGFVNSAMRETATQIVSIKTIVAPDASIRVGNWQISNAGFSIGLEELASERVFYPVLTELQTNGTTEPYYWKLDPLAETAATLADKSETFTSNSIQFVTTSISNGIAISYKFDSLLATNDVNLVIRLNSHTDDTPIFDYKRATGGTGFNLGVGETVVNLPILLFFETSVSLYITIESPNSISLKGQTLSLQQTPWARVNGRVATKKEIATKEYVDNVEHEKEEYVLVTTNNYNVTLADLYDGKTFVVAIATGQNWNLTVPASNTVRDDNHIYKTRIVIVGESNESLTVTIAGGEVFTKGMTAIKLYRNINDDVIIGVLNNVTAGLTGWQREGDNRIVCDVRRNTNLAINASTFTAIPFQVADRNTNDTITNWTLANAEYIESIIRQECNVAFKLSINASIGGGIWTVQAKLFVDRKQSNGSFVEEAIEISRAATGNFGGEDQLLAGDANIILNAGDRVRVKYSESNLSGNFTSAVLSVTSNV